MAYKKKEKKKPVKKQSEGTEKLYQTNQSVETDVGYRANYFSSRSKNFFLWIDNMFKSLLGRKYIG